MDLTKEQLEMISKDEELKNLYTELLKEQLINQVERTKADTANLRASMIIEDKEKQKLKEEEF